jgi:hypothetical protein
VGVFSRIFGYNFLEEHYANVTAYDDIQHRAAITIAEQIRNGLAAYFAKNAETKAAAAATPQRP